MKTIILLRHGEVDINVNKNISAQEFGHWIDEYNNSKIRLECVNKDEVFNLFTKGDVLVCSTLKRSLQSIELFDKAPSIVDPIFNEAELPFSKGHLLKLNPKVWLVWFRILWFFGYSKDCESYKEVKVRAKNATKKLITLSEQNKTVLLVGHGIMNKLIHKELLLQKWIETKKSKSGNWEHGMYKGHP